MTIARSHRRSTFTAAAMRGVNAGPTSANVGGCARCGIIDASMLQIHELAKCYGDSTVFSQVSLSLRAGEFVALIGESGVGKSTLLNCIAGLDRADEGRIVLAGTDLATLDDDGCARLRRERVGFVFQAFHVLPHLPVAENVALPLWLAGHARGAGI
jgi:putative ABC transport system ATP-binding protein